MVVEITLQPVRRYGVDAAILFSDIVVPLRAVGVGVDVVAGVGPVVDHPIRARSDLDVLRPLEPGDVAWAGVGCVHAFANPAEEPVRWLETQAPAPPARHSYRFERDWHYLRDAIGAETKEVR